MSSDDDTQEEKDGMTLMMPDILVCRMEEARRLIKDMKQADVQQRDFLVKATTLLLDSCDVRFARVKSIPTGDNVTPLN